MVPALVAIRDLAWDKPLLHLPDRSPGGPQPGLGDDNRAARLACLAADRSRRSGRVLQPARGLGPAVVRVGRVRAMPPAHRAVLSRASWRRSVRILRVRDE